MRRALRTKAKGSIVVEVYSDQKTTLWMLLNKKEQWCLQVDSAGWREAKLAPYEPIDLPVAQTGPLQKARGCRIKKIIQLTNGIVYSLISPDGKWYLWEDLNQHREIGSFECTNLVLEQWVM